MPEIMVFKEMVEENSVPFIAHVESTGHYADNGDWISGEGPTTVEMDGIILPLSDDDLKYTEAGTYSIKNRKIITTQPLEFNQNIEYKGAVYTVQNFKDYSDYADVFIYFARWREK
jgi:hypothetical protein